MTAEPTKLEFPDMTEKPGTLGWQDLLWRSQETLIAAASRNDAETIRRLDDKSVISALAVCNTYAQDALFRADWKAAKEWSLRAARLAAAKEKS